MNRLIEGVVHKASSLSLEPSVLKATGHGGEDCLVGAAKHGGAASDYNVAPSMYAQFDDDMTLLHLSEGLCFGSKQKEDEKRGVERKPENIRGGGQSPSYAVCPTLVESIPANLAKTHKGAVNRLLPTYDTLARLFYNNGSTKPTASTGVISGHKRFYPAHFTSYYAYAFITSSVAAAIDFGLWSAMGAIFLLVAFGGILSTVLVLWITCLSVFAPKPVVNAPTPMSPLPIFSEWTASYLYHMLSVGTFGSPSMGLKPPTSMPHHFALSFQFIADNVRASEGMLFACAVVLLMMIVSAVFNFCACFTLALAPSALHRQMRSNGNNSMSSVIALAVHTLVRRYSQHASAVRARAVRYGRHGLIAMIVLKLTINMFLEMDKQGMFPVSRMVGASASDKILAQNPNPLEDIVTSAAAFNRVVGFISATLFAFVSADLLAGRVSSRFLMKKRLPFFVTCEAPTETDEEKLKVSTKELTNEFTTHAAICPRLPDRLRLSRAPMEEGKEKEKSEESEKSKKHEEGLRMYYAEGVRSDVPAAPKAFEALNWLTDLSPFVLSSDFVALADCFRKLVSVAVSCLWMLIFWRWPSGIPFLSTLSSLSASASVLNGPAAWLVALWTGHTSTHKGKLPAVVGSFFSLSSIVLGVLLGLSLALIMYASRATAPSDRVAYKRSHFLYKDASVGANKKAKVCVPTLDSVLSQRAKSSNFKEYVAVWLCTQVAPFLHVLDNNSVLPSGEEEDPSIKQNAMGFDSASNRPMNAMAKVYAADRSGFYATSVVKRGLVSLPFSDIVFMMLSFVVARQILLFPFIGLVTSSFVPKMNAPRLSQPDISLLTMVVESNPILVGALLASTLHLWYVVLTVLRDARENLKDTWGTVELTISVTARVAHLMGRTNTPLFRPLRHGYCDGVYDLLHAGHKRVMERAAACCDRLFAGSMCDEDCLGYKRRPIMTTSERAEEVARSQGVYRCLPASPPKGIPVALLAYYGITQIIYGEEYYKEADVYFVAARELGIGITAPRTNSISTSDLLRRINN